jgi:hypothetical protein
MSQYGIGHASEDCASDTGPAVARHGDQVDALLRDVIHDGFRRVAFPYLPLNLEALGTQLPLQRREAMLADFAHGFVAFL